MNSKLIMVFVLSSIGCTITQAMQQKIAAAEKSSSKRRSESQSSLERTTQEVPAENDTTKKRAQKRKFWTYESVSSSESLSDDNLLEAMAPVIRERKPVTRYLEEFDTARSKVSSVSSLEPQTSKSSRLTSDVASTSHRTAQPAERISDERVSDVSSKHTSSTNIIGSDFDSTASTRIRKPVTRYLEEFDTARSKVSLVSSLEPQTSKSSRLTSDVASVSHGIARPAERISDERVSDVSSKHTSSTNIIGSDFDSTASTRIRKPVTRFHEEFDAVTSKVAVSSLAEAHTSKSSRSTSDIASVSHRTAQHAERISDKIVPDVSSKSTSSTNNVSSVLDMTSIIRRNPQRIMRYHEEYDPTIEENRRKRRGRDLDQLPDAGEQSTAVFEKQHENATSTLKESDSNSSQTSALRAFCQARSLDFAKELIANGANLELQDSEGTALHHASKNGETDLAILLAQKGAVVDARKNDSTITPLYLAVLHGHTLIAQILLFYGASAQAQDENKTTVLHLAAQLGDVALCKMLVDKGANVNAINNEGFTPLILAAREKQNDACIFLIKHGVDVTARTLQEQKSAYDYADKNGLHNVRDLLVLKGAQ